jgi:hypothetical protein
MIVRLRMLLVVVIPSTLLWESVTICHLNPPKAVRTAEVSAQGYGRKPWSMAVFVLDSIRWLDEQRLELSSLVHSFVVCVEYTYTVIEDGLVRRQIQPAPPWYRPRLAFKALLPNRLE